MAAIREATPALSKGLLSGEGPEEDALNSSGGSGTYNGPSSPSSPLESTFLRRQTSPQQRGQPTDQATKATASRGHGRAIRPAQRHLNAVVLTTLGTSCLLVAVFLAIALAPMPSHRESCFGCCTDDAPCMVEPLPPGLVVLNASTVTPDAVHSSGYIPVLGSVEHSCYCSTVRSSESPEEVAQDFLFQRQENEAYAQHSSLKHLLDPSLDTLWCSLPRQFNQLLGRQRFAPMSCRRPYQKWVSPMLRD